MIRKYQHDTFKLYSEKMRIDNVNNFIFKCLKLSLDTYF